jgi:hypothetical protein
MVTEIPLAGLLPAALLIDLPEIDVQHEEIFRRIEALKETCYGNGPVSFDEFESLLDYLKYHFATEESIAQEERGCLRRSRQPSTGRICGRCARRSARCVTALAMFIPSCALPNTGLSATSTRKTSPLPPAFSSAA